QSGVVGPAERPHGFTRFESVSIANPGLSDTRFTWWNPAACAAAGAMSADVTRIVPTTAANRSRLGDLRASMWPPHVWRTPCGARGGLAGGTAVEADRFVRHLTLHRFASLRRCLPRMRRQGRRTRSSGGG